MLFPTRSPTRRVCEFPMLLKFNFCLQSVPLGCSFAVFASNFAISTFCVWIWLPALVESPISPAVSTFEDDNGLPLAWEELLRLRRSRASTSASENCRRCFGLNGLGVETRDVRN